MFEYVVWDNIDNTIHRGPWSEKDCVEWIDYGRKNFGPEVTEKLWSIKRREVGRWESY